MKSAQSMSERSGLMRENTSFGNATKQCMTFSEK